MEPRKMSSMEGNIGDGTRKDDEGAWKKKELDEAMEDLFKRNTEKFSYSELQKNQQPPKPDPGVPKFDEEDYNIHRMGSFRSRQPLHRHHHKKLSPDESAEEQSDGGGTHDVISQKVPEGDSELSSAPAEGAAHKYDSPISGSRQSLTERPLRPSLKKPSLMFPPKMGDKQVSFPEKKGSGLLAHVSTSDADVVSRYNDKNSASEPLMSERAGVYVPDPTMLGSDARVKVKFHLGAETSAEAEEEKDDELNKKHLAHKDRYDHYHRHHHHHRRHSSRRMQRQGSEHDSEAVTMPQVVEPEEAELLQTADLDDIASRRFEDPRGIRRHKIQAKSSVSSFIHPDRKGSLDSKFFPVKKIFDHQPHEIFVELDELCPDEGGDELEWRETARWIRYEENVQEGADRWGKPHVATLSFHSLLSLRKCIEQGTVLLDLEEKDLAGVAHRVVENMVVTDQLKPEHRGAVMRALLLRHKHISDRGLTPFGLKRNNSGYGSMNLLSHDRVKSPKLIPANGSYPGTEGMEKGLYKLNGESTLPEIKVTLDNSSRRPSQDLERIYRNTSQDDLPKLDTSILRRIPEGAEATTALVGALDFLEQPIIAFVRLAEGLIMQNLMEVAIPVRFIFILLGPIGSDLDYHEVGRSISTLMANSIFHGVAYRAGDRKDLLCAINEFLDDSIVLPPDNWERKSLLPIQDIRRKSIELRNRKKRDLLRAELLEQIDGKGFHDPLKRTGRLFGGLVNEIKHRYPLYLSDFTDGFNAQCIAATIFIYFAALAGAITFGGLMGDKTGNLVGVSETLICTSAAGVIFALLSGQPLIIIGTTGPLLLYDEILFKFCTDNEIEYLPMRVWIGFWFGLLTTICVAFEGSTLVRFFTRFTQEIFTALISLLYIFECLNKLVNVFMTHPLLPDYCNVTAAENMMNDSTPNNVWYNMTTTNDTNTTIVIGEKIVHVYQLPTNQPNTALLTAILTIGTFFIAYYLRQFRNSKFLGRSARRALGDFGVPIAMVLMVALGYLTKDTYTQKLSVPEGLTPSDPEERGWLISPLGLNRPIAVWHIFAASVASVLLYILIFLEVQICELILNKKDRKLKKGGGFHLDLLLMGYIQIGVGLLGGPFMCAATVRSVSHLASVIVMSRTHAPGEMPHVIEVKEQRLSSLLVSLLVGVSVLMAPLLRQVPVGCLFGVFLYMGVSSMSGIQLFERIQYLFMPVKHHPELVYISKVRTWKMNMYTLIQVGCLGVLWVVKSTEAALAFPFVLLMMIPVRLQLKCCFTPKELAALDGEYVEDEDLKDEPDFYEQIVP